MIAGNSNEDFLEDLKYNMTPDLIQKIAFTKKALNSEYEKAKKLRGLVDLTPEEYSNKYMSDYLESTILPSIYNGIQGHETQSSFSKDISGADSDILRRMYEKTSIISDSSKYEDGSILEKAINGLYNYYSNSEVDAPTEKEMEKEEEKISKMTKSVEDSKEDPSGNDENLKSLTGYKQLESWLKTMKGVESKKKKMRQITKVSDLQKVSCSQLALPRALLMKKIMNQELYCKQTTDSERFMHISIDRSGSMGSYNKWRNQLVEKVFADCVSLSIKVETGFWNTELYTSGEYGPQKIRTKDELKSKCLSVAPRGDDRMGYCTVQKLQELKRQAGKQYLLIMSDGTGSIDDREQRDMIYKLAAEKNVDVKFALFSKNNDMCGTKKEDIFYIYD